jgi:biopolymer transport protein TolQ
MFPVLAPPLAVGGVLYSFSESNFSGQAIVVVLFLGSVFAWTLMAVKGRELGIARRNSQRFMDEYRRQTSPLAMHIRRNTVTDACPVQAVYGAAVGKLAAALDADGAGGRAAAEKGRPSALPKAQLNAVRVAAERAVSEQSLLLERHMGLLATAVTTAPFLGLLGTVWGVMDAFSGMAMFGSAMLSAVAPGISGALLTTVVGLLVALPSSIGYNLLSDRIRRLSVQMDTFAQEFLSDVERRYTAGD